MAALRFDAGNLSLNHLRQLFEEDLTIELNHNCKAEVDAAEQVIEQVLKQGKIVYGINTGFGKLVGKIIPQDKLITLQHNLIRSHCVGVGEPLCPTITKLITLLKINCLAQGHSGVRWKLIEYLEKLCNSEIIPYIPAKGSVGASGDLAPLAHLNALLIGEGQATYQNKMISGEEALSILELQPLMLQPKEGLSLINGTQVSTAILAYALYHAQLVFNAAISASALTWLAVHGNQSPLDARIHQIRKNQAQQDVAQILTELMQFATAPSDATMQIQDPYSIRCQPQVMGTCLNALKQIAHIVENEMNAVTDNPLVFADTNEIRSGGNFHAEPIAFAADQLAWTLAEIGNISERRIALLCDGAMSGLPNFLIENNGEQSGFMMAQVTAAALASENKMFAHPIGIDSIPTSGNQEDHVSMATSAAYRLLEMIQNTAHIISIELIAATQGIHLSKMDLSEAQIGSIYEQINNTVPYLDQDRPLNADIKQVKEMILGRKFELSCFLRSNVY